MCSYRRTRHHLACVTCFVLLLPLPLAAQSRSDADSDRSRSQQSQDERDQGQQRDRDQRSRDDSQNRDRERTQSSDQSEQRDQSSREESDRSQQQAGLGVTLMETRDGVRVRQVLPGSPAERAGLRAGDFVLSIDDERIRSVRDAEQTIREKEPGEWVDLEVWRNGQRHTIEARLASRQQAFADQNPSGFREGAQPQLRPQQQFQDSNPQALAQQIQALQRQLAQLRQEVERLRSEQQVLRPTFEDRRQSDQERSNGRSYERRTRDESNN